MSIKNPRIQSGREYEIWIDTVSKSGSIADTHVAQVADNPHGTSHVQLNNILAADDTSTSTVLGKHVTDALVRKYEQHRTNSALDEHAQYLLLAGRTGQKVTTPLILGTSTDNLTVEIDGSILMNGNATTYNDINTGINPRNTGVGRPTLATFVGNIQEFQFAVNDFADMVSIELLHDWKEGSPVEIHCHWATGGANDATVRGVKWEVEYSWANMLSKGGTTAFVAMGPSSTETSIAASQPDRTHNYTSIVAFTPTGGLIGAQLSLRIKRIASVTNTAPVANPFLLSVGIHYERDTLGSRTTTGK